MSKRVIGFAMAGALLFSSTASVASTAAPAPANNPWASLSMLSGAAAAATYCGAAATLAGTAQAVAPGGCVLPQGDAVPVADAAPPRPIPVPPVEAAGGLYFDPLLIGLGALALGALVYFLLIKKGGSDGPNSPP